MKVHLCPQLPRMSIDIVGNSGQPKIKKPSISAGLGTLLDFLGLKFGGGGGNRTPVRKSSTQSVYMLSSLFGSRSGYSSEQDFTRTSLSITAYPRDAGYEARSLK